MPYIRVPRWARVVEHMILGAEYALVVGAGVFIAYTYYYPILLYVGILMIISGLSALFGVVTDRYRWEFVGLPFILTGLGLGAVIMPGISSFAAAALVAGFALALGRRFIQLVLVGNKVRRAPGVKRRDS